MRSILIQLLFFVAVFHGISFIRETSMLSTDTLLDEQSLQFTTTKNQQIDIQNNQKKTVMYFFAPWCQVCNYSIENLQKLYDKKENLDIVAVALDYSSTKEVDDFINRHQLSIPIVYGSNTLKKQFKVSAYPSYYVLDKHNAITAKSMGYSSETGLLLRTL